MHSTGASRLSGAQEPSSLNSAMVEEVPTRHQPRVLEPHAYPVFGCAISPSGKRIASSDKKVRLWDASTGQLLGNPLQHEGHKGVVYSVCFTPDGELLLSGGEDKVAVLWDLGTQSSVMEYKGHTGMITGVAVFPSSDTVATASYDRTLRLWHMQDGTPKAKAGGHTGDIECLALSGDGTHAVTGADDCTARVYNCSTMAQEVQLDHGPENWVYSVQFSADGSTVLSGSKKHNAQLWDLHSGQCIATLVGHAKTVMHAIFADPPAGHRVLTASRDNTLKVWDLRAVATPLATLAGHTGDVNRCAVYGEFAASGSDDKTVRTWLLPP
eukprot:RCo054618